MSEALSLPVRPGVAAQRFRVVLDGRRYRVDLDWLARIGRWTISLYTDADVAIWETRILATRSDLLRQHRYRTDAPPGTLTCMDRAGLDREPDLTSLGADDGHSIVYVTADE